MMFYGNVLNRVTYTIVLEFMMTWDILVQSLGSVYEDRTHEVQDIVNLMVLTRVN